jgi:hypothetical protein
MSSPTAAQAPDNNIRYRGYIAIIDSLNERSIGLGRRLLLPLLKDRDAYVSASTLRGLGLVPGDEI